MGMCISKSMNVNVPVSQQPSLAMPEPKSLLFIKAKHNIYMPVHGGMSSRHTHTHTPELAIMYEFYLF